MDLDELYYQAHEAIEEFWQDEVDDEVALGYVESLLHDVMDLRSRLLDNIEPNKDGE